ncbi:MAG: nucleoside phosphorylase [Alphaproteobacteria bacterium]|nr:nucleoside phosphorylase [Alphaproteobacteria bacterium]
MPRLGIIAGLKSELDATAGAWPPGTRLFAAGGSADRAAEAARGMARDGVELLISLGLAGGLDPALRCGDLVIASAVVVPAEIANRSNTETAWREKLAEAARGVLRCVVAPIVGLDAPVTTAAAKAGLFAETSAVAVDMESHGVARAAADAGLPFLVLRVIADPADRAIPWSAMAGMAPDGSVRPAAVIGRLMLRPWEVPAIVRLARDSRHAHAALGRVAAPLARVLAG